MCIILFDCIYVDINEWVTHSELIAIKKINAITDFNAGKNYTNQQCQQ